MSDKTRARGNQWMLDAMQEEYEQRMAAMHEQFLDELREELDDEVRLGWYEPGGDTGDDRRD